MSKKDVPKSGAGHTNMNNMELDLWNATISMDSRELEMSEPKEVLAEEAKKQLDDYNAIYKGK